MKYKDLLRMQPSNVLASAIRHGVHCPKDFGFETEKPEDCCTKKGKTLGCYDCWEREAEEYAGESECAD